MNSAPAKSQHVACAHCGADVEQKSGRGRVRRFCTPEHGKMWRRRARFYGWI